jgi:hypothetical protein
MSPEKSVAAIEAIYDQYFDMLGRTVKRVAAEAESVMSKPPVAPERYLRIVGQLAVLDRLLDDEIPPLDSIEFFFGEPRAASADAALAAPTHEEAEQALQRILDRLAKRWGTQDTADSAA